MRPDIPIAAPWACPACDGTGLFGEKSNAPKVSCGFCSGTGDQRSMPETWKGLSVAEPCRIPRVASMTDERRMAEYGGWTEYDRQQERVGPGSRASLHRLPGARSATKALKSQARVRAALAEIDRFRPVDPPLLIAVLPVSDEDVAKWRVEHPDTKVSEDVARCLCFLRRFAPDNSDNTRTAVNHAQKGVMKPWRRRSR